MPIIIIIIKTSYSVLQQAKNNNVAFGKTSCSVVPVCIFM